MAIFSVRFLWRARTRGDFPVQSSTWQWRSRSGQPAQDARPIYVCTEHAQFVDASKFEFMAATFHEGLWT